MSSLLARKLDSYMMCIKSRMVKGFIPFVYASIMGALIGSRGLPALEILVWISVLSFAITTSVYVFNDIMEIELDRINEVKRPIAQSIVSKRDAGTLVLILVTAGVTTSYLLNMETFLLTVTFLTLGFFYSVPKIYLKKRFLMRHVTTGIGLGVSGLIGGAAVRSLSPQVWYAAFLFFMIFFGGSPIGDLLDIPGDRKSGIRSITALYGPEFGLKFSIVSFISTILITVLLYSWLGFNILTPIFITGSGLSLVFLTFSLMGKWHDEKFYQKTFKRMVVVNMTYQLGLVLGVIV